MDLKKLITRLNEIYYKHYKEDEPLHVELMEEHEVDGRPIQFSSEVTDVACTGKKVIIIGQEIL
jgi:hypothetical protein